MNLIPVLLLAAAVRAGESVSQPQKIEIPQAAPEAPKKGETQMTEEQKTFYALGGFLGRSVVRNVAPFNLADAERKYLMMGLKDSVYERPSQVDLNVYGPKLQELQQSRASSKADGEKKKSRAYLEKAAKEKGAKVFPSGLIFTEVSAGSGPAPVSSDTIKAHYKGTLVNGTEFDSSYKRGAPLEFDLGHVIPCWTEGIQKMKVGGKAKLVCPSDIGYGDMGNGGIPGGAALTFEVELVEIVIKK